MSWIVYYRTTDNEWGTTNHCAVCTDVPWPCDTAIALGLNEGENEND